MLSKDLYIFYLAFQMSGSSILQFIRLPASCFHPRHLQVPVVRFCFIYHHNLLYEEWTTGSYVRHCVLEQSA